MPIRLTRLRGLVLSSLVLTSCILFAWMRAAPQTKPYPQNQNQQSQSQSQSQSEGRQSPAKPGADYSGMYSFLREGEFVQITVEDQGRVTGFISRYGDSEGDRGVFLEHFFKSGQLEGNQLTFATETVHGVSFEFRGTVERGEGKIRSEEAYYLLKGILVENTTSDAKKTSSSSTEVALKSFPQDLAPPPAEKK